MFRDVTFGQYYPTESFIHRMDPRVKLLLSIMFMVGIFFVKSYFGFAFIAFLFMLMIVFSRVPLGSVLKTVKPVLLLMILIVVINIFTFREQADAGKLLWSFSNSPKSLRIYSENLIFTGLMALRLLFLVTGASILTLTTTPVALTDGLEYLLTPLKVIKFPVHDLALIMSIALKFIPNLMEETDRIIRAQKARGADFDTGGLIKRAKAFVPILIPLLISAFRRADDLALAMDGRCYGYTEKRTKMKRLKCGWRDIVGALTVVGIFAAVIVLRYSAATLSPLYPWMYF